MVFILLFFVFPENLKSSLKTVSVKKNNSVRYHSGGSMKLNACNLLLAHMVYL
jgi:hypothetical protein